MNKIEPRKQRKHFALLVFILCLFISLGGLSGCSSIKSGTDKSTDETPEYAEKIFGVDIISLEKFG